MAVRRITGTGATNGATVTANGTPGGNPLTVLSLAGTATLTWSDTTGVPSSLPAGSKAIRMQCPATTDTVAASLGAQTAAPLAGSAYIYIVAWNSAILNLFQYRTSGQNGGISLDATHHLRITNAGGTVLKVFTNALSLNTLYRIDAYEDPDTTTTGTVQFGYYLEHSATPVETLYSVTNVNVGTADNTEFRIGKSDTTGTCDLYIWGLADNAGATGLIGPAAMTGTLATTLDDSVLAGAGTETISGTLATTLDSATMAASGDETITGVLGTTLDDSALSVALTEAMSGTLAVTLDDVVFAATGTATSPGVTGSLATTLDDVAFAASGSEILSGTLTATLDDAVLTAAGVVTVPVTGTLVTVLSDAGMAAVGTETFTGTLTITLDDTTLAASGELAVPITGTLTTTLDDAVLTTEATVTVPPIRLPWRYEPWVLP